MLKASCDGFEEAEIPQLRLMDLPQVSVGRNGKETGCFQHAGNRINPCASGKMDTRQDTLMHGGGDMGCLCLDEVRPFEEGCETLD